MKRTIALLPLLLLLPAALATTLTATSPLSSNSVIEYSGTCTSSGKTVGVQISFSGNMVHFDQLTTTGTRFTSSSSTTYTASNDGSYVISASCDGESSVSTTVCVGSSCPSETTEEDSDSGSSGSSSGGGSSSGLVVVGGNDNSDSDSSSNGAAAGAPSAAAGSGGGAASSSSGATSTQKDEPVIDEPEEIPTYVPDKTPSKEGSGLKYSIIAAISLLLVVGGFMMWRKFKKPKEYVQLPSQNPN